MQPTNSQTGQMELIHSQDIPFEAYIKIDNDEISVEDVTPVRSPVEATDE